MKIEKSSDNRAPREPDRRAAVEEFQAAARKRAHLLAMARDGAFRDAADPKIMGRAWKDPIRTPLGHVDDAPPSY